MKKQLLLWMVVLLGMVSSVSGQNTLYTSPPLAGGNGSAGTVFNIRANSSVFIDTIYVALYGTLNSSTNVQLWYNTTPVSGPPNVSAPAWTQIHASFATTIGNTGTTNTAGFVFSPIVIPGGLLLNAGSVYGFAVGISTGSAGNFVYTGTGTVPAGVDTFTNGFITIYTGVNVGYGGPLPSPTFHVRQFTGGVSVRPASGRDARLASIVAPTVPIVGANQVIARVQNAAADSIVQVDFGYQLDNNPPVLANAVAMPAPLTPGQTHDYTFAVPVNIPAPGSYTLRVWARNANGQGPDNNTSNDTITRTICTGISGTVTVGPSGTYPTVASAVAALNNCGISGPVTVLIQPGTYYGSYTIANIPGLVSPNTITFTSSTSNAADVILIHDTAAAAVNKSIFTLNNSPSVSFSSLTFQRTQQPAAGPYHMIRFNNESNFGSVISCVFQDLTPNGSISFNSYGIYADNSDNLNISGNSIDGYYYSIYLTGPTTNNAYENFNQIVGNTITNYRYAIYVLNQALLNVIGNTITTASTTFGYGTYISRGTGTTFSGNIITGTIANGGMYFFNMNDSVGLENVAVNNVISGNILTTGYGIYASASFSATATAPVNPRDALVFYHNTVNVSYGGVSTTNTAALFFTGGSNTTPAWNILTLTNNNTVVRARTGGGMPPGVRGMYLSHDSLTAVTIANYNNYFLFAEDGSQVTNGLVRANVTDYGTIATWTTAFGQDANSISTNPNFVSQTQPIPSSAAANNLGTPLASVTTDVLGLSRSTTAPDMGAYEFSPPANDAGLMFARGTQAGCADDSTTVTVKIANYGTAAITSLTVGYFSTSGAAASATLSGLNLLTGDTLLYTFAQRAVLNIGMNNISAYVTLTGDQQIANDSAAFSVNKFPLISTFPYFQDWENGTGGWAAGGNNSSWALGTPSASIINSAFSGSNAWATNLSGDYNNSELSYIQSPCFNLTGLVQPYLEFKLWWVTETTWDGLNVQYSVDGGNTWQVLGSVGSGILNWYTRASVNSSLGEPVWAGSGADASPGYVTVRHSLSGLPANSTAIFRLRFSSDASVVFNGVAVDDFVIGFPPPADMSVIAVTSPTTSCNGQVSDTVRIRMVNAGTVAQSNFPVSYRVNNLTPVTETYVPIINPGDTVTYTFTTLIAGGLPVGTQTVTAYPSLTGDIVFNNDTARRTVTVVPSINTFPYVEGFENGNGGWTSGGANSSWAWGVPNDQTGGAGRLIGAYNGANAWVTNLTGNYNNSEASWIMSPCFDMSALANVRIRFGVWYHSEASWDGGNLQYSIDGGNTWTVAGALNSAINWYNTASVNSSLGQPVWAGLGPNAWLPAEITLPQLANQANVRLRVNFYSDGSVNSYTGIGIDSFVVDLPTDPVISSVTTATDSCINSSRAITANIVQFRQLTSVNLHYNITGTQTYTALPMTRVGTTSNWTATIPVSAPATRNRYFVTVVDSLGLTDTSDVKSYIDNYLGVTVFPTNRTAAIGDTVILRATATGIANVKITEVVQFRAGTGATPAYPAYAVGQDLVEISNLGNGQADLSGYTFEVFGVGARQYTFPSGAVIPGNSIMILHIGTGTDDPANVYYNTGGGSDNISSISLSGYLLKDAAGQHVDAVATNGYTFDVASGVTAAQWSGNIPTSSAGVSRINSDNNTAADWVISSTAAPMTVGTLNPGMTLSTPAGGIVWNTTPPTNGDTLVVGPFTTPGTFTYTATVSDGRCTATATATIVVGNNAPDIGVSLITAPANGDTITLNVTPTVNVVARIKNYGGVPASGFDVEYRVNGGASIITNSITQTIAPGDSMMHTFTLAWAPTTAGTFRICANTTGMPNEVIRNNDTSCVNVIVRLGGSVDKLFANNRLIGNVYPNPAESFVNFEFNEFQGKGTLEIHDKLGRVVATIAVDRENGNVHTLRTDSWSAGMYSYRFIARDQVQHGNLIIRH